MSCCLCNTRESQCLLSFQNRRICIRTWPYNWKFSIKWTSIVLLRQAAHLGAVNDHVIVEYLPGSLRNTNSWFKRNLSLLSGKVIKGCVSWPKAFVLHVVISSKPNYVKYFPALPFLFVSMRNDLLGQLLHLPELDVSNIDSQAVLNLLPSRQPYSRRNWWSNDFRGIVHIWRGRM